MMIYDVLQKYNLHFNKQRMEQLEKFGNTLDMEDILDYLIQELHISPKSIEKCPSILYANLSTIKNNYEFLLSKEVHPYFISP